MTNAENATPISAEAILAGYAPTSPEEAAIIKGVIAQARWGYTLTSKFPAKRPSRRLGGDLEVGDCLYQDGAILRIHSINEDPLPGRRGTENLREVHLSDRSYKIIYRDVSYTLATI